MAFHLPCFLAKAIGGRFAYVQSLKDYKSHFNICDGERVLIACDDIYSRAILKSTVRTLSQLTHNIAEIILCLSNFSGQEIIEGKQIISLVNEKAEFWDKDNCPMCQEGSSPVLARPNWRDLILVAPSCFVWVNLSCKIKMVWFMIDLAPTNWS